MSDRDDLKAYLDNELPPTRMEEVRVALEADQALRDECDYLKSIGESIRSQAAEPEIVGLEATLQRISNPKIGFWEPVVRRPILSGFIGLFLIFVVTVITFPVFAQSKASAKRTSQLSAMKQEAFEATSTPPFEMDKAAAGDVAKKSLAMEQKPGYSRGGAMPDAMLPRANDHSLTSENVRTYAQQKAKNRMVVSNAQMSLKVEDAQKALDNAQSIVAGCNGYIENSNSSQLEGELPTATCVFRVPCTQFDNVVQRFRKLGSVLTENIQADDVTLQYADINARLKVIRIEEQQYLTMLRNARRTGEIMEIRDRLSQVRQQIESMDAQQKALMDQASLSTISVTFVQRVAAGKPEEPNGWADETWGSAVNGLSAVGRFLGRVTIFLFVFSPIWIAALVILWIAKKRIK